MDNDTPPDQQRNDEHSSNDSNGGVKGAATEAVDAGKAYAKNAVNSAGKKLNATRSQLSDACDSVVKAINDEPVKAVVATAVVSSLLTTLLVSALRPSYRYYD
ncbi:Uncharacterised protein [Xylophilus ampelinus]|jgi:hypothetical protein|nr:hypothetical protein [Variovorax sp.]MBS0427316.1 hypothetical protein [Pseudomonadota bacterium]VTY40037.1 Uncharacterised protein [Xylophilus ampelinus]